MDRNDIKLGDNRGVGRAHSSRGRRSGGMSTYRVERDCCTSGNCACCRGVTPFGKPLRVVQARGYTEQRAKQVAANWRSYKAEAVKEDAQ